MKTAVALNHKQIAVLTLIAKYRFVTVAQVQQYFGLQSRTSVNSKLDILVKSGYVGMRYDSSYKLRARPAAFYLTPKALRLLQAGNHINYASDAIIRSSYSDRQASEQLVDASLALFTIAQSFERAYANMRIFTARQLGGFDYFPRPLPDLYLVHDRNGMVIRYFLYHFRDSKRYDIPVRSRIQKLITYREAGSYEVTGNDFPIVFVICDTASIERLAQRTFRSALNKSYESLAVYTTSKTATANLGKERTIWSPVDDPEELIPLDAIE